LIENAVSVQKVCALFLNQTWHRMVVSYSWVSLVRIVCVHSWNSIVVALVFKLDLPLIWF
jgi:hypothetical protein